MIDKFWRFFTSLRLTVVCLGLGIVLVFLGTLAQVNEGLWQAQTRWFKSFFIWWGPASTSWKIPVLPGGYLLGIVLLLNLVAAHIHRFQFTRKKVGINLTHFGIILLLVGQLATDRLAEENVMNFREGESRNYVESHQDNELVFITDAATSGQEQVVSIPESFVAAGKEITHQKLPFTIRVKEYFPNCEVLSHDSIVEAGGKLSGALATVEAQYATAEGLVSQAERALESEGRVTVWREALKAIGEADTADVVAAAKRVAAQPDREGQLRTELKTRFQKEMIGRFKMQGGAMRLAAERLSKKEPVDAESLAHASSNGAGRHSIVIPLSETKEMDKRNLPGAVLELVNNGQSLGTWFVSPWLNEQPLAVAGSTWRTALRWEREYLPYSVKLVKTTHEVYRGTQTAANPQGIPKNYQSRVRIENPQTGENREVDIYMNNPLRYAGLTFYQSQMDRFDNPGFSGLQVVRNPSWLTPYFGCAVVGLGLLWQFLYHLIHFMNRRRAV
jgi:hypothetical protein